MQQRAIETRRKILEAAARMYVKKGYHYTTVDEIAKEAGVSTGIAYKNFKNKKKLLLACLENIAQTIRVISETEKQDFDKCSTFEEMAVYALEQFEKLHKEYYAFHEELEDLRHRDADVKKFYTGVEQLAAASIVEKLSFHFGHLPNLRERVALAMGIMENYCHMTVEERYGDLDFGFMKAQTVRQVEGLFKKVEGGKALGDYTEGKTWTVNGEGREIQNGIGFQKNR